MAFPRFMKDGYGGLQDRWLAAFLALAMIALILGIGVLAWGVESYQCGVDRRMYHRPTHYTFLAGCFIEVEHGQWVEFGQYRAFRAVGR